MSFNIKDYLEKSHKTLRMNMEKNHKIIEKMGIEIVESIKNGGKLIVFGNGGSASDAQHIVCELVGSFLKKNRKSLPAIALNVNTSTLTSISNDFGYDYIFEKQIEALGKKGDISLGISTSGNSKNVNSALKKSKELGLKTFGFSGKSGGDMVNLCDLLLIVPSNLTPNIQEAHISSGHAIAAYIEEELS